MQKKMFPNPKFDWKILLLHLLLVENDDDESVASIAAGEIKKYLDTVKSKRLLIYPYAHLSSNLAAPATAVGIIKAVERYCKRVNRRGS